MSLWQRQGYDPRHARNCVLTGSIHVLSYMERRVKVVHSFTAAEFVKNVLLCEHCPREKPRPDDRAASRARGGLTHVVVCRRQAYASTRHTRSGRDDRGWARAGAGISCGRLLSVTLSPKLLQATGSQRTGFQCAHVWCDRTFFSSEPPRHCACARQASQEDAAPEQYKHGEQCGARLQTASRTPLSSPTPPDQP